jgi:hypothetical protein
MRWLIVPLLWPTLAFGQCPPAPSFGNLLIQKNLAEIAACGPDAQAAARDNLGVGRGSGTVTGPSSTTSNYVPLWNSTDGTLLGTGLPSYVTIGSTSVNLGATQTTFSGLTLTAPMLNSGALFGTFSGSPTATGIWTLSNSTASTSPSTGALVVTGGVGIGGALQVLTSVSIGGALNLTSTQTWSGTSAPNAALSGLLSSEALNGFSNDGGSPPLNYFRVTNNFAGLASTAYWFEDDTRASLGGHVGLFAGAANDSYTGYRRPLWTTGTTYAAGQVVTVGAQVIYATTTGVSGVTTPTCSKASPTCSDGAGGVSWAWEEVTADDPNLVGAVIKANPTVSWGGTSGSPIGDSYGINVLGTCGAAGLHFCIGDEQDVGITAGNTAQTLVGMQIIISGGESGTATAESVGFRFGSQGNGATPFQNLIALGAPTSATVISTTGYGIQAFSENGNTTTPNFMAGAGAVDMQMWQPSSSGPFGSGFAWRSQGAQILGNGDVQSNYALLHTIGAGASLDVSEYQVATVTANGDGTGWSCTGKWARGSNGSIVSISTISGGAVTGIALVLGAFSSSNLTAETFTADQPYNCGTISASGANIPPTPFTVTETSVLANSGSPVLKLGGTARVAVGGVGVAQTTPLDQGQGTGGLLLNLAFASTSGMSIGQTIQGLDVPTGDQIASIVSTAQVTQAATGSFASGQKVIPVSVTTGYAVGQQVTDTTGSGVIGAGNLIASIQSGVSITLVSNTLTNSIGATDTIVADPVVTLTNPTTAALPATTAIGFFPLNGFSSNAAFYDQGDASIVGSLNVGGTGTFGAGSAYSISLLGGATGAQISVSPGGGTGSLAITTRNGQAAVFNNQVTAAAVKAAGTSYILSGSTIPTPFANFGGNPTGSSSLGGNTSLNMAQFGSATDNASANSINYVFSASGNSTGGTSFDGTRTGYYSQIGINVASPNATTYGAQASNFGGLAFISVNVGGLAAGFGTTQFGQGSIFSSNFYAEAGSAAQATFTGTIVGATLTVSSVTGTIAANQSLVYTGSPVPLIIASGSGSTWTLSQSPGNIGPISMTSYQAATMLRQVVAQEDDCKIQAGASSNVLSCFQLALTSGHATHGTLVDQLLVFAAQTGVQVGVRNIETFGRYDSEDPCDQNCYIGQVQTGVNYNSFPWDAAGGYDFLQANFTGSGVNGGGFALRTAGPSGSAATAIDGSGGLRIGTGLLIATGSGISLDTPLYQFNGVASIVSGGANYTTGDYVDDGYGDYFSVTASGGVVSSLTLVKRGQGQLASPTGTISMNTLVREGTTYGGGLQITETAWAQATTIGIGTVAATALNLGNSGSVTTLAGSIILPSLASGTAAKYVCVTSGNVVIVQAGAC